MSHPASAATLTPVVPERRGHLFTLALLAVTIASASAMRIVFSPLQEIVAQDLRFTDLQISLIQGVAASLPVALLSIPIGRMTDRGNRARLLLTLSVLWTAGALLTVFAVDFWQMFFARTLASIGAMCALTVAISMAADLTTADTRGRSLLALALGNTVGAAAAFALGGGLLGVYAHAPPMLSGLAPWRSVFFIFAMASVVLTIALLTLRDPPRQETSGTDTALRTALRALWRRRALLAPLFLGQVTVIMADAAASIWAAPVLSRNYGLQPDEFAGWMGLVMIAAGVLGAVFGGLSADFGHKSRLKGGILIGAVIAALLSIPGAFFPIMPDATGFALMLALLLTCGAATGLVTAAAIAVLVPNDIRGVCLGAFIVIGAIIGFGLAPVLVTAISDAIGGAESVRYALAGTGAVTSVLAAIAFLLAMRAAARDAGA